MLRNISSHWDFMSTVSHFQWLFKTFLPPPPKIHGLGRLGLHGLCWMHKAVFSGLVLLIPYHQSLYLGMIVTGLMQEHEAQC